MNTQRVAGWFMIGVFLPIASVFILTVASYTASPRDSIPFLVTVFATVVGVSWLLKRMTVHCRPHRPHTLFTPYYDQR